MLNLGEKLKLCRMIAGLTQRALAEKLSVSANYISLLEKGSREPSLSFLKRFATETEIPLYFLFWEGLPGPGSNQPSVDVHVKLQKLLESYALLIGAKKT